LLTTLNSENAPLKLLPAVPGGKPLISTVACEPGTRLCGVLGAIVTVTMFAVRCADAIFNEACDGLVVLTAVRDPAPPGVTNAKCAPGSKATCGLEPVFSSTKATGQYEVPSEGANPGRQIEGLCDGSRFTINPAFVLANATSARCVKGSIPTEYGKGEVFVLVEPPEGGIRLFREIVSSSVPVGAVSTARV
jgi:hypothetical protein